MLTSMLTSVHAVTSTLLDGTAKATQLSVQPTYPRRFVQGEQLLLLLKN